MSNDLPDLRASHEDRDRVVDALRVAGGDGLLTAEEHGKLFIVSSPGIVIDTDGLTCTYSKLKLHSKDDAADSRLRVEFVGTLLHAKIIEQRPRR